jgi:hypothetical protein
MDITKEQIEKMATEYAKQFDYAEDSSPFLDYIAGFEKALSLFAVGGRFYTDKEIEKIKYLSFLQGTVDGDTGEE